MYIAVFVVDYSRKLQKTREQSEREFHYANVARDKICKMRKPGEQSPERSHQLVGFMSEGKPIYENHQTFSNPSITPFDKS